MSEEKKNPPQAQIFRYFRIENRNNNQMAKICCFAAAAAAEKLAPITRNHLCKENQNVVQFLMSVFFLYLMIFLLAEHLSVC